MVAGDSAPTQPPLSQPSRRHLRGRDRAVRACGATGWASSVCAGDYDNDGWIDLFVTYFGQQRALPQSRRRAVRGRHRSRPGSTTAGTRWGSGCTLRRLRPRRRPRSLRRQLPALRSRVGARAGAGCQLPLEGHPGQLRSEGAADRHQSALSQPRRRHLRGRLGGVRHRDRHRTLSDDRRRGRPRRRRLARHLRGVRLDRGDPVPQQPRRHVHRRGGRERRRLQRKRQPAGGHGRRRSATSTATAVLDLLKTHFADDIPALYRNLGKGLFEDVAMSAGLGVAEPLCRVGRRACRISTTTACRTCSTSPATSIPEVERMLPQYPHRGSADRLPEHGNGALRGRDGAERRGATTALEPRRRVRRLRQRRRRRRARHEHERAAVAAAQRLPRRAMAGSSSSSKGAASNRSAIGATVDRDRRRRDGRRARCSASPATTRTTICGCISAWARRRQADRVEVRWPSGRTQVLTNVHADSVLTITEAIEAAIDRNFDARQ